jgi:hypothetical protein
MPADGVLQAERVPPAGPAFAVFSFFCLTLLLNFSSVRFFRDIARIAKSKSCEYGL